jgi:hypothetical protein
MNEELQQAGILVGFLQKGVRWLQNSASADARMESKPYSRPILDGQLRLPK